MPRRRCRNVCFTINNPDGSEIDKLRSWDLVSYCAVGHEVGASGTPHLQGYLEFHRQVDLAVLKNRVSHSIHVEERRGTPVQARDYALKDDHPDNVHWGVMSEQGHRSDLDGPLNALMSGVSIPAVARLYPHQFVKFHKGLTVLKSHLIDPRCLPPRVCVIYGATGTGKSREARLRTDLPYVWGPEQGSWFDGYEGQLDVIFEEFRGQLPFGTLLRLLDRYDCRVQIKGGSVQFVAMNIIFTSPVHPQHWYPYLADQEGKMDQLFRRIHEIVELTLPPDYAPARLLGPAVRRQCLADRPES